MSCMRYGVWDTNRLSPIVIQRLVNLGLLFEYPTKIHYNVMFMYMYISMFGQYSAESIRSES